MDLVMVSGDVDTNTGIPIIGLFNIYILIFDFCAEYVTM